MKKFYRKFIKIIEGIAPFIEHKKTYFFEILAIYKKRKLYEKIKWSKEEQENFDRYWKENYGKKISNKWHRLYQSINGIYNIEYLPEIIFSTAIEPNWNKYWDCKIYENKSLCELFFRTKDCTYYRLPDTFLVREGNILYDKDRKVISKKEAIKIINFLKEVVLKPTKETSSGNGVCLLKNRDEIIDKIFNDKLYTDFILQEKIIQSDSLNNLNRDSINTFRIITYIYNEEVNIGTISLRVGTNTSFVDNIHSGGLVVNCNKNCKLDKYAYKLGWGDSNEKFIEHPTSKIKFENYEIKSLEKIIKVAEELHGRLPGVRIISWDFTLDKNNIPVLIESNLLGQSIWFPQIVSGEGIFGKNTKEILKSLGRKD